MTRARHTDRPPRARRKVVFDAVRSLRVEHTDTPTIGPDDVAIDVESSGICGSDLHWFAAGGVPSGTPMGHEYAGIVSEVGANVDAVAVGQLVAVLPTRPCGVCSRCRARKANLCENASESATSGGFADTVVLHRPGSSQLFAFDSDFDSEAAALLEPLAVAVRGIRQLEATNQSAGRDPRSPVLVLGLGTVGLMTIAALRAMGNSQVIAVDVSEMRREAARALGADRVLGGAGWIDELTEIVGTTKGVRGYPTVLDIGAVLECSGARPLMEQAVTTLTRPGAVIVQMAVYEDNPAIDLNTVLRKELSLIASFAYTPADFETAHELLSDPSFAVQVARLITHRFDLDEANAAFDQALRKDEAIKVLFRPGR